MLGLLEIAFCTKINHCNRWLAHANWRFLAHLKIGILDVFFKFLCGKFHQVPKFVYKYLWSTSHLSWIGFSITLTVVCILKLLELWMQSASNIFINKLSNLAKLSASWLEANKLLWITYPCLSCAQRVVWQFK